MNLTGKIIVLNDTQQISDSFKLRKIVIETADQYPQKIEVQFVQDKCDALNGYSLGDQVEVAINIRGREWTNPKDNVVKYFNTIEGWMIKKLGAEQPQAETFVDEEDDLPF